MGDGNPRGWTMWVGARSRKVARLLLLVVKVSAEPSQPTESDVDYGERRFVRAWTRSSPGCNTGLSIF